jgi:hypothetical protein
MGCRGRTIKSASAGCHKPTQPTADFLPECGDGLPAQSVGTEMRDVMEQGLLIGTGQGVGRVDVVIDRVHVEVLS